MAVRPAEILKVRKNGETAQGSPQNIAIVFRYDGKEARLEISRAIVRSNPESEAETLSTEVLKAAEALLATAT